MKLCITFFLAVLVLFRSAQAQGYIEAVNADGSHAGVPVYSQYPVGYVNNGTVGWQFSSSQDIVINSLGWLLSGTNLPVTANVSIGLWSQAGTLLGSTVINSNAVPINGSLYEPINPIFIPANKATVITAGSSGFFNLVIVLTNANPLNQPLEFNGYFSQQGNGFIFPTGSPFYDSSQQAVMGATFLFQAVPEPGVSGLLILGSLLLTRFILSRGTVAGR